MSLWYDYRFQLDLLQIEFARAFYHPKMLLLALFMGATLTFCNEGTKSEQALLLVYEAHLTSNLKDYKFVLDNFNKAIKLDPQLSATYAERGNFYLRWSKFLDKAQTNRYTRSKAQRFGFDLNAAPKYRQQARIDYQQALQLAQDQDDFELIEELNEGISCMAKGQVCYVSVPYRTRDEIPKDSIERYSVKKMSEN